MMIGLGGIAKDYAADEAARVLNENGIKHAIINLGGNVYVMSDNPEGRPWKIAFTGYPSESEIVGVRLCLINPLMEMG